MSIIIQDYLIARQNDERKFLYCILLYDEMNLLRCFWSDGHDSKETECLLPFAYIGVHVIRCYTLFCFVMFFFMDGNGLRIYIEMAV